MKKKRNKEIERECLKKDILKVMKTRGNKCHKSRDKVALNSKDSARTIQNDIRLTYLISELLQLVDNTVLTKEFT